MDFGSTEVLAEEIDDAIIQDKPLPLVHVFSYITLFSAVGVVIRKYTTLSISFLPGYVYPQLVGCFLMGIFVNNRLSPLMKLGLQTGLCGSITSFSTFILQTYLYFYTNVWDAFASIGAVSGLCFAAFRIGSHIRLPIPLPDHPKSWILATVVIYPAMIVIFVLSISVSTGLAILVSPIGSLIRWYCSRWNLSDFPLGTFAVNCLGVFLVCLLKISENLFINNSLGCSWMIALELGFVGCLSTVSSFVAELDRLEVRYAYRYFVSSILAGLVSAFLVLGVFTFTGNKLLSCEAGSF
jgi:fluoride ion exporter CrcB/FEX